MIPWRRDVSERYDVLVFRSGRWQRALHVASRLDRRIASLRYTHGDRKLLVVRCTCDE